MKHGARNDIPVRVVDIKKGGVTAHITAQVAVELDETSYPMSSVMTPDSLDELDVAQGAGVHAVATGVNVLLVRP